MTWTSRRLNYVVLCAAPFVASGLAAARPLRIPGVYQIVGALMFAGFFASTWSLGLRVVRVGPDERQKLALAGGLLLAPFALVALLWVGLGPPWVATPTENRMRYLVLLVMAMAVATAFVVLKDALSEAGERMYSMLGFATNIFAGAAYMVWLTIYLAAFDVKVREGKLSPEIVPLINMSDTLLFVACVLTYLTTASFAASMGRAAWLGRGAARAYVIASLVALLLIVIRGLSYPDPNAAPWYTLPGFIAGIPAVPWIMPSLLGVVLLKRAGEPSA